MPYTALAVSVKCPFFIKNNPQANTITCEGYDGCRNVQSNFKNKRQLMIKATRHCQGSYEDCPIFQMANQKYEGRD